MHSRNNLSGPSILVGSGVMFATISIFVTYLARTGVGIWLQLAGRLAFSVPVFFLFLWVFFRSSLRIGDRDNITFFIQNGLLMLFSFGTFIASIALGTPPQKAILLMYLYPLYVALGGALFLGEKLSGRKLLFMALGLMGLGMVLEIWHIQGLASFQIGDALAALNGVLAAAIVLVGRWSGVRKQINPITLTFWSLVFALVWLIVFGLCALVWLGPEALTSQWPGGMSLGIVVHLLGLAVLGTVLPYSCMFLGLERTEASIGSMLMLTDPLFVFVFSFVFLHQPIGWWQVIGGGLILWPQACWWQVAALPLLWVAKPPSRKLSSRLSTASSLKLAWLSHLREGYQTNGAAPSLTLHDWGTALTCVAVLCVGCSRSRPLREGRQRVNVSLPSGA